MKTSVSESKEKEKRETQRNTEKQDKEERTEKKREKRTVLGPLVRVPSKSSFKRKGKKRNTLKEKELFFIAQTARAARRRPLLAPLAGASSLSARFDQLQLAFFKEMMKFF